MIVNNVKVILEGGGVIMVSTPGQVITRNECLEEATRALKKFVVGGVVGGLSDYSVYSWPSFNQKWNLALVGPG